MTIDLTNVEPAPQSKRTHLRWKVIAEKLRSAPGEWVQLMHSYKSDQCARVGVSRAAKMHNFEFRVTARERQADGKVGVFMRWNVPVEILNQVETAELEEQASALVAQLESED